MSEHQDMQEDDEMTYRPRQAAWLLSEETVESLAALLRVLADPTRIRLIAALNERGKATVSALAAGLPLSQQGVSHQLGILYQAGIVRRRREGVWVHYELCDWTGWWLLEQLAAGLDGPDDQPD